LISLGWQSGMPEDLRQKIEAALRSPDYAKLGAAEKYEWIAAWVKANMPKAGLNWQHPTYVRLLMGTKDPSLADLRKLATIQDHEFESQVVIDGLAVLVADWQVSTWRPARPHGPSRR
jgi:hypothetical protein